MATERDWVVVSPTTGKQYCFLLEANPIRTSGLHYWTNDLSKALVFKRKKDAPKINDTRVVRRCDARRMRKG